MDVFELVREVFYPLPVGVIWPELSVPRFVVNVLKHQDCRRGRVRDKLPLGTVEVSAELPILRLQGATVNG